MNKALPWNVNGVGFDAREAAREAARRQGKSLGEWLHGVIADHATSIGIEPHEIAGQQRIDAVTSKLERLSARSADHDRRLRAGRSTAFARRRTGLERDEDLDDHEPPRSDRSSPVTDLRGRRESPASDSTELLLEEAIDAMERRALRTERHTDKALQSFNELLARNEARRDRERDSVTMLAEKLSAIETRLADRVGDAADDNPIKGALARLETRLDNISRRSAAEAAARRQGLDSKPRERLAPIPAPEPDSFHRLEEKLNSIYQAIQTRPHQQIADVSPLAIAASQTAQETGERRLQATPKDRRLGDAIANIAKRQHILEDGAQSPHPIILPRQKAPVPSNGAVRSNDSTSFIAMQTEIAGLATKIEDLRRDVVLQRQSRPQPTAGLDALRTEIASMARTLRDLAPRNDLSGLETSIRTLTERIEVLRTEDRRDRSHFETEASLGPSRHAVAGIESRGTIDGFEGDLRAVPEPKNADIDLSAIAQLSGQMQDIRDLIAVTASKIDKAAETPRYTAPDVAPSNDAKALESLVRDLSRKMEAVQAPDATIQAFDALQQQIGLLSARFERSDEGLAKLTSLERSMRDLFAHLDETRATVETSAARTAREVLRIAMEEGRVQNEHGTATSLATIQALQEEAEARTSSTLTAVHGTLEKVVSRLAVMEGDLAEARKRPPVRSVDQRAPELRAPELRASELRVPEARTPEARGPEKRAPELRLPKIDVPLDAPHSLLHQALGTKPADKAFKTQAPRAPNVDDENGRADFIAAARRAAKVAQADPSLADMKRAAGTTSPGPVRAGLIEQSRDYVTRHKRPVLLSIAALFIIVGTMTIIQRMGVDSGDLQSADTAPPVRVASETTAAPTPRPVRRNDDLSPSALPTSAPPLANQIPGSDPIQTGSIPSLPSFAAASVARLPAAALPTNLKAMAEAGDGAAAYMLGAQYAEGNVVPRDFALAAQWYQKAAARNLAPAQYRLASLYEKGLGVVQDKAKAKTLYLQSAEAGNPRAMHNLAVLLADGDGHPDYDGAATWFRKAAQYGIHDSQYNLAILLARGIGVDQSLVQSYQWFAIAAAQGDVDAGKKRDEVATKLGANDLAVAKALASSFRPRLADRAATEVQPPPGGWDGASGASPLNSARPKISSL